MKVFRLSRYKYSAELNGKGAAKFGNRWNSKGVEIIYTAESRALAMAEVAVHVTLATLPGDYVMVEIDIPDSIKIEEISLKTLSEEWNNHPHTTETQKIGDTFMELKNGCVLKVPSAVVRGDFNYLINPYHPEMNKIKIIDVTDFPFDKRLFE